MLRTPKADEIVVIYETLKNRVSKSHTQVIDLRPEGRKYALRCVTHDFTVERNVRLATESESHKSHLWCPSCTEIAATINPPVVTQAEASEWDELAAAMIAPKVEVEVEDTRMSADEILEIIGNASSRKGCDKKFRDAGK